MIDNEYKKSVKEATENILLNAVDSDYDNYHDYEADSLDWSWNNVMEE